MSSGSFDVALTFVSTKDLEPRQVSEQLFQLDGKSPPKGGRVLTPVEAARQLSLGVIGELVPRGYAARDFEGLVSEDTLRLDQVRRVRSGA
jgi:hypothetical protein